MPGDGSKVMQAAADALKTAHTYGPVDVEFRRKDGSNFTAVLRCFLSVDPQGRRLVWSLIEDVTEIRAKEAALLAESQTLAATRARFLAAIEALDEVSPSLTPKIVSSCGTRPTQGYSTGSPI